jgi:hypothetical protein
VIEGGAWFDGWSSMGLGEKKGNGRELKPQGLYSACLLSHKHCH